MRQIIHIDMDAFYASVEVKDHPEYRGKPVIVGSDPKEGAGRGVVSAASYEARRFGIHSAMPISRAYRLCPSGIFVEPRMERYVEISRQVFAIFRRYTDLVEGLSLDEAFLDVTGSMRLFGSGEEIGRRIKAEVKQELALVCSVGVAPNKFIAKIASDIDKPDGFVLVRADEIQEFLGKLPVERLWGVGEKTSELLRKRGLRLIGDVAALTVENARLVLGEHGEHLHRLSRGLDERPVIPSTDAKSVGAEHTFEIDTADREKLLLTLLYLSDKVAARLRKAGYLAGGLTLKFRDESFSTVTRSMILDSATDLTKDIYESALVLLDRTGWHGERRVRLLGVSAGKLGHGGAHQGNLFADPRASGKLKEMEKAVDAIRGKYGKAALKRAALVGEQIRKIGTNDPKGS